jgi:hypothetical protein
VEKEGGGRKDEGRNKRIRIGGRGVGGVDRVGKVGRRKRSG